MKAAVGLLTLLSLSFAAHASRIVDLPLEAAQAANFAINCPEKFHGKTIKSVARGTFPEGISMIFTFEDGDGASVRWEKATRTYKCD